MSGRDRGEVFKRAKISDCGSYRYDLWRGWDVRKPELRIIMLNPSTADASLDDPTIRRCMTFAEREGFGGIIVVNLFAFRATSPADMKTAPDPFGPEGSDVIEWALSSAVRDDLPVLCAWGTHGAHRDRASTVMLSARGHGTRLVCLGVNKDGHPRHPLYVAGNQPFLPFPHPDKSL